MPSYKLIHSLTADGVDQLEDNGDFALYQPSADITSLRVGSVGYFNSNGECHVFEFLGNLGIVDLLKLSLISLDPSTIRDPNHYQGPISLAGCPRGWLGSSQESLFVLNRHCRLQRLRASLWAQLTFEDDKGSIV